MKDDGTGDRRLRILAIAETIADDGTEERKRRLEELCGGDRRLQEEVLQLLGVAEEVDARDRDRQSTAFPASGSRLDRYRLLQRIGEGGFGEVWMAEQVEPVKRRVAIKLIKPGMDTGQVIARFEAERQALALMDHPNIARVFDAGTTSQGRPYFVMELVKGLPITEYCREANLDVRERIALMQLVCSAVQHAHHKGVIHRDLKPGNVLVGDMDGHPVPKVIDFGVAKALERPLTDKTLFTEFRQFLGTPEYMSPEQADLSMMDVDTRSDVYALGVLLYELLVGSPPFDPTSLRSMGFDEMRRVIKEQDPPSLVEQLNRSRSRSPEQVVRNAPLSPQKISRLVRGDLDWIVQRAMSKERDRRYASASDFSDDLGRYLAGEAVAAGPPSFSYRSSRYLRRHRTGVSITAAAFLVIIGYLALVLWDNAQIRKAQVLAELARAEAVERADEAEAINAFLNETLAASRPSTKDGLGRELLVRDWLDSTSEKVGEVFKKQPAVEAELQTTLGYSYLALGRNEQARNHLARARALYEEVRGPDHPKTLNTIDGLTMLALERDRLDEAEANLRTLLAIRREKLGPDSIDTRKTEEGLAVVLKRRGKMAEAETLYLETLEAKRKQHGEMHEDVLRTQNNLSKLYLAWGRPRQAIDLLQKTIAVMTAHPELDLTGTLDSRRFVAECYIDMGRLDEAEAVCLELEPEQLEVFGPTHTRTFHLMETLGRIHILQGRPEKAHPLLLESTDGFTRMLSGDHIYTRRSQLSLAECLLVMGQIEQAEELAGLARSAVFESKGADHPDVLNADVLLARVLDARQRPDESEDLLRSTIARQERVHGVDHPITLRTLARLSELCARQEHLIESIELTRRALKGHEAFADQQHPLHWSLRDQLIDSLERLGRGEEAAEVAREGRRRIQTMERDADPAVRASAARLLSLYPRLATGSEDPLPGT